MSIPLAIGRLLYGQRKISSDMGGPRQVHALVNVAAALGFRRGCRLRGLTGFYRMAQPAMRAPWNRAAHGPIIRAT